MATDLHEVRGAATLVPAALRPIYRIGLHACTVAAACRFSNRRDECYVTRYAARLRNARPVRHIATVLRPGGVTFYWFSTLFALPFVVNRLMPESLAGPLLDTLVPRRLGRYRKFPARTSPATLA